MLNTYALLLTQVLYRPEPWRSAHARCLAEAAEQRALGNKYAANGWLDQAVAFRRVHDGASPLIKDRTPTKAAHVYRS